MGAVFDGCRGFFLTAIADEGEFHLAADRGLRNGVHEVIAGLDGLAVYAGDDVATLKSSFLRGTARFHSHNHDAIGRAERLQRDGVGAEIFLEADADGTARHAAVGDDLVVDINGGARWKREADAFVAAAAGNNRGVDANDL